MNFELLSQFADEHLYPLLFATVSGAHLYGFESPNSDYDLRGVHLLPFQEFAGFKTENETVIREEVRQGIEVDLVTHDAKKFFQLMLRRNGYVLEQLYSPIIIRATPEHEQLKDLGRKCITRHHVHHYLGFAKNEREAFAKNRTIKALLYCFRVLLTGVHLMNTGEIEANLTKLARIYDQSFLHDLIKEKRTGEEFAILMPSAVDQYGQQLDDLEQELKRSAERSSLPSTPISEPELNDLLLRVRKVSISS